MVRYSVEILSHSLYNQLLSAHVACLRIATLVDLAQDQCTAGSFAANDGQVFDQLRITTSRALPEWFLNADFFLAENMTRSKTLTVLYKDLQVLPGKTQQTPFYFFLKAAFFFFKLWKRDDQY